MIVIPSKEWAERYRLQVIHYKATWKDFVKLKATELANKLFVDNIQERYREQGVSRKIWENVIVKKVIVTDVGILVKLYNEYYSEEGFDVALAREKGTDDHFIQPLRNAMQFTRVDPNIVSNLPKALSWIQGGVRRFSKGHWVSGLPRLDTFQEVVMENEYEFQTQLNDEFKRWKNNIFRNI